MDVPLPEGIEIRDVVEQFVTPGIIDVHSHLGDYQRLTIAPTAMAMGRHRQSQQKYGPSIACGPKILSFLWRLQEGNNASILPGSANLFGAAV